MKKYIFNGIAMVFLAIAFSFKNNPESILQINIRPKYNGTDLILKSQLYINTSGDSLYIDNFKFYLSNCTYKTKGKWLKVSKQYFLFNAEDKSTYSFNIKIPASSEIDSIKFIIGVDSLTCVSGAMDGALDPINGMFWSWNTGYINAKLEGRSNACTTVHHEFGFHIGGYMQPFNTIKEVKFKLNSPKTLNLIANAESFMDGKEIISLKNTCNVVTPGKEAVLISNNYTQMLKNE